MGPSRYHHLSVVFWTVPRLARQPVMPEAIKMRERAGRYCPDSCAEALRRALKSCKSGKAWRHTTICHCCGRGRDLACFFCSSGAPCGTRESLRVISTARLSVSPRLHLPPIDVVVFNDPQGDLILWLASRLDAFSAYPYQTRLPGGAPGGTTGRPEVCPSRSSRTSDRATQISDAHNR